MRCSFIFKNAGIASGPNRVHAILENEDPSHSQRRTEDGEVEGQCEADSLRIQSFIADVSQPHQPRKTNADGEERAKFSPSTELHESAATNMASMATRPSVRHDVFADSLLCNPGILKIFHPRVCTLQAALSRMFRDTLIGIASTSPLVTTDHPCSGEKTRELDAVVKLCRSTFVCMSDTCSDSFRARFGNKRPEAPAWSQKEVGRK